ncbi:MAG: DUF2513 domain-containing protein [Hyphomicrobium sp.]|uniref:DUF2513 domain-containing protein n=1 Tax=Hyphomicrobium sp. TaxID=82 RepID=UPI0013250E7E|nr:DUF2513 domain-containing protein [Hyphomicrobium sp.]KAB2940105.1 MAG: DUF2513 domain-containing protein [Hyphomicrobium sp.]MBZ0208633.1 DUF2513 domain-containing protein [Hyphomicrobium sp.]
MTRDMDLLRGLLLIIEEQGERMRPIRNITVDGYSDQQVTHHIWLLMDGGFIEAVDFTTYEKEHYQPRCLTWRGTEFLETVRERDNWEKTKSIAHRVGTDSLKMLMEIATKVAQDKLAGVFVT